MCKNIVSVDITCYAYTCNMSQIYYIVQFSVHEESGESLTHTHLPASFSFFFHRNPSRSVFVTIRNEMWVGATYYPYVYSPGACFGFLTLLRFTSRPFASPLAHGV